VTKIKTMKDTPTKEAYNELQAAYDWFNAQLFNGDLPPCLITLQRKTERVRGYFSPRRFDKASGEHTDELAMNPMHFRRRSVQETLSTLVHEMVHVWQHHRGKSGRGGYHNKEWGAKMKAVGLYPSNTGQPGGKETGDQMTHYIIEGGVFQATLATLLKKGFQITWAEWMPEPKSISAPGVDGNCDDDIEKPSPSDKSNRVKYVCGQCSAKAWGKPKLLLVCGKCRVEFVRSDSS
jgi:hypothetical protein